MVTVMVMVMVMVMASDGGDGDGSVGNCPLFPLSPTVSYLVGKYYFLGRFSFYYLEYHEYFGINMELHFQISTHPTKINSEVPVTHGRPGVWFLRAETNTAKTTT